jgi:translation initiation factor 2 beta subunit (eIF-2beta)/eIF-5
MGKTIIKYLDEFCAEIRRKKSHLLKFIEWELGITIDDNNECSSIIKKDDWNNCILSFLEHFVFCANCINLDTKIVSGIIVMGYGTRKTSTKRDVRIECNQCHFSRSMLHEELADLVRIEWKKGK